MLTWLLLQRPLRWLLGVGGGVTPDLWSRRMPEAGWSPPCQGWGLAPAERCGSPAALLASSQQLLLLPESDAALAGGALQDSSQFGGWAWGGHQGRCRDQAREEGRNRPSAQGSVLLREPGPGVRPRGCVTRARRYLGGQEAGGGGSQLDVTAPHLRITTHYPQ